MYLLTTEISPIIRLTHKLLRQEQIEPDPFLAGVFAVISQVFLVRQAILNDFIFGLSKAIKSISHFWFKEIVDPPKGLHYFSI